MSDKIVCFVRIRTERGTSKNFTYDVEDTFEGTPEAAACYILSKYTNAGSFTLLPAYLTVGLIETGRVLQEKLNK
jgi:hypothetical protein